VRFSYWSGAGEAWDDLVSIARHVESTGWDGFWIGDHFMPPAGGFGDSPDDREGELRDTHEGWTILAGLAAVVPRIRIGPLVTGNTYRNPCVLAKMAATVDHISGGRVVLGLGAGWQENEHRHYGIGLPPLSERMDRLEEAAEIIKSLFANTRTDFAGRHYEVTEAPLAPKPVQDPLPLLIGGGGEKRTLRIVARFADEWNVWGSPEIMGHKMAVLDRHCVEVGRDPAEIERSAAVLLFMTSDRARMETLRADPPSRPSIVGPPGHVASEIARYVELGVDELIVPGFNLSPAARTDVLDRFITEVAAPFRNR
jgi:F420-dependent oxidoreductase-like protein